MMATSAPSQAIIKSGPNHNVILGLGAGDLTLTIGGANEETIQIPNVLFVNRKVKAIERLIGVKPEDVRAAHT